MRSSLADGLAADDVQRIQLCGTDAPDTGDAARTRDEHERRSTMTSVPAGAPSRRVNHFRATPQDDLSWRPLQRSTRFAVSVALIATVFYMVFLLNPAYRGNPWVWLLVVLSEGLVVFQALATWWTVLVNDPLPDPPEVYVWRRRLLAGEVTPTVDVFITVYGEPLEIVLGTVRAARDMRVPHKTWVLDDGDSDEL